MFSHSLSLNKRYEQIVLTICSRKSSAAEIRERHVSNQHFRHTYTFVCMHTLHLLLTSGTTCMHSLHQTLTASWVTLGPEKRPQEASWFGCSQDPCRDSNTTTKIKPIYAFQSTPSLREYHTCYAGRLAEASQCMHVHAFFHVCVRVFVCTELYIGSEETCVSCNDLYLYHMIQISVCMYV